MIVVNVRAEIDPANLAEMQAGIATMEDLLAHFQVPHTTDFQALMAKYPSKSMDANFYEATQVTPPGM